MLVVPGTLSLALVLSSCAPSTFATFSGAKEALPQAQYQVLGQTRYDQKWIDETIEAEIAGFGMKRPERRPASLAARPVVASTKATVIVKPPVRPATPLQPVKPPVVTVVPITPKLTLRQRLEQRIKAAQDQLHKLEHR